jgi:putative membrane protein
MIVRDTPRLADLMFAVRGSIVPVIAPRIAFLMVIATLMVGLHLQLPYFPTINDFAFTVFGVALSLFLGFRNNAAYDRWWEARKLWGGLLADVRSIAREAEIFVRDEGRRHAILRLALDFLHLHRRNLRGLADDPAAAPFAPDLVGAPHPPCAALDRLTQQVAQGHADGSIDGFGARALAKRVSSMAAHQAGCERIAGTPLPYVYSLLIYRTTYLYCLLLPLALVEAAGWLTPIFVGVVGYMFLGLAEVSEELSHPFGATPNALPLDAIYRATEISLAPHLGERAPEPLKAQNFYLN